MVINSRTMKRILYLITIAILMASCGDKPAGKTELSLQEKLLGQWHSTSMSVNGDLYIEFEGSGSTFELYQQIGEGAYRLYRGKWNLEEDLLTGRYNDGEEWHAAYTISIENGTLTMTSRNDAAEKSVFEGCEIPANVKVNCITIVKSY